MIKLGNDFSAGERGELELVSKFPSRGLIPARRLRVTFLPIENNAEIVPVTSIVIFSSDHESIGAQV